MPEWQMQQSGHVRDELKGQVHFRSGASGGNRTPDPQFTKLPLCRLSYAGLFPIKARLLGVCHAAIACVFALAHELLCS